MKSWQESFRLLARFPFMPSTVIRRFDYRPEARELEVLFVTGRRYVYAGVPPEEVEAFRSAFSKGRYFNAHIRDHYHYRELA
jgi:hypothetical protein